MALRCSNCGEEKLRDEARFCDRCGTKITESLVVSAASAATQVPALSHEAVFEDRGISPPVPALRASDEETTTRLVAVEPPDGSTSFLPPMEATEQPHQLATPTLYRAAVGSASFADFQPGYLLQDRYR